jgi:hypothetical protein
MKLFKKTTSAFAELTSSFASFLVTGMCFVRLFYIY